MHATSFEYEQLIDDCVFLWHSYLSPIWIAEWSQIYMLLIWTNIGVTGSNPMWNMDVHLDSFVLFHTGSVL